MNFQVVTHSPYTFLPSGILIVEPHEGLLAARTMLLAAADYYVGVSSPCEAEDRQARSDGYEVAVAILSESLGYAILSATAQVIRERWPYARILVFGRNRAAIEDNLYDARIDDKARPENLLAALASLSEDPWNQRVKPDRVLTGGRARLAVNELGQMAESDPTERFANTINITYRDLPAGEHRFRQAS